MEEGLGNSVLLSDDRFCFWGWKHCETRWWWGLCNLANLCNATELYSSHYVYLTSVTKGSLWVLDRWTVNEPYDGWFSCEATALFHLLITLGPFPSWNSQLEITVVYVVSWLTSFPTNLSTSLRLFWAPWCPQSPEIFLGLSKHCTHICWMDGSTSSTYATLTGTGICHYPHIHI